MEHPKLLVGRRMSGGCRVVVRRGAAERLLDLRLDLWSHSPTGFEWGYNGSGPAQLALAILAEVLRDDAAAVELHQHFKAEVVVGLHKPGWTLPEETVWRWLGFYRWRERRHADGRPGDPGVGGCCQ